MLGPLAPEMEANMIPDPNRGDTQLEGKEEQDELPKVEDDAAKRWEEKGGYQ